jgi:hypothetical protein
MTTRATALLIAFALLVVYNANGREIGSYDSQPAKFLAVEIATRHTLTLNYVVGRLPPLGERAAFAMDLRGNYRSALPLPSSLGAAAVAWVLSAAGLVDLDAPLGANLVAKLTASLFSAAAAGLAFVAASRRTSRRNALIVALGFGLGTNMWASVSQTLWQQETALCALMGALTLLADRQVSALRCLAIGALLGLAGWARPQLSPTVVVLAGFMLLRLGWRSAPGLAAIAAFGALAMSVNLAWFGHPLGAVPALETLHSAVHALESSFAARPWESALGLLISPSRGLLVFSPVVAFAAAGVTSAWKEGWRTELSWCAAAAAVQFLFYAMYGVWWGGHTFGPRYVLDILPPLVLLASAGMPSVTARPVLRLAGAACLAWSILAAGTGAFVYPAEQWNMLPADVDRNHARLWEWQDSQLRRAARSDWSPQNFSLFSTAAVSRAPQ